MIPSDSVHKEFMESSSDTYINFSLIDPSEIIEFLSRQAAKVKTVPIVQDEEEHIDEEIENTTVYPDINISGEEASDS